MLDGLLESIGLIKISRYDKLKELYCDERDGRAEAEARVDAFEKQYDSATDLEAKARYASPDGKKVLKDLQAALNYVRDYQRSLWVMLAPDNHYYQAKQLLEEWGMKPHSEVDETRTTAIPGIPRDRTGSVEHDRYGLSLLNSGNDD
jgi:hypothetical protein